MGSRGNQDSSVFVGNLGFEADQRQIEDLFGAKGIKPLRIRVLKDDQGQSKGAAFVDFENPRDAQEACKMDGTDFGKNHRRLRINPAGNKPGGR